jgi:diadenosine tetraphosphate (Ap4A) HIT family hydrolase
MIFYETENFDVNAYEKPFVSREEGGHIIIFAKDKGIPDRTFLSPHQAVELARLTMLVGEAFPPAMASRNIPLIKVNYIDSGNWAYKNGKPFHLHVHIMGRVEGAKIQTFPEALKFPPRESGFYDGFAPLDDGDIGALLKNIRILEASDKYSPEKWKTRAPTSAKMGIL